MKQLDQRERSETARPKGGGNGIVRPGGRRGETARPKGGGVEQDSRIQLSGQKEEGSCPVPNCSYVLSGIR